MLTVADTILMATDTVLAVTNRRADTACSY